MKSLFAISLMLLGTTTPALAQDSTLGAAAAPSSVNSTAHAVTISTQLPKRDAVEFTSGEEVTPVRLQDSLLVALEAPPRSLAALSFATPASAARIDASGNSLPPSPARSSDPSPASPRPPYGYNEREYNLEIALGVSVIRFRSSVYEATGVGKRDSGLLRKMEIRDHQRAGNRSANSGLKILAVLAARGRHTNLRHLRDFHFGNSVVRVDVDHRCDLRRPERGVAGRIRRDGGGGRGGRQ